MKVLVAFDGSDCAKAAVQDLRRAGLPKDTQAFVLSVADLIINVEALAAEDVSASAAMSGMVRRARALARDAVADARETATAGAKLLAAHFPGWQIQSGAEAHTPYSAVIRKAGQWPADLVVVGSHGRSQFGRLILGSVSQKVLAYAPCSVRVGRCGELGGSPIPLTDAPVRVLLAVDDSTDSAAAAEAVRLRAWPTGTAIRVVTSVDLKALSTLMTNGGDLAAESGENGMDLFRIRVDSVARDLREANLSAESAVLDGDPKRSLLQEAERWGADCIFLGAKGHSRLSQFVLGSVSAAVAARAHCSVEVVRMHR